MTLGRSPPGGGDVPFNDLDWDDQTGLEEGQILQVTAHAQSAHGDVRRESKLYAPQLKWVAADWLEEPPQEPGAPFSNVLSVWFTLALADPAIVVTIQSFNPPPGEFIVNLAVQAQFGTASIFHVATHMDSAEPPP